MSVQRTGYEILVEKHYNQEFGVVNLKVSFDGIYEDRGDALLMIIDAWADAMKLAGFDPLTSLATMLREGTLQ